MELGQTDRDRLRSNQYKLNNGFQIGHIVEHQTQDPRRYKKLSSTYQEERPTEDSFKIEYQGKHQVDGKFGESTLNTICEDDLPITTGEVQDNLWLNMDKLELDKLAWTTTKACRADHDLEEGSTRFDRDGRALASSDTKLNTEPEDSHDVESLVRLLDSVYQPQVTYALNVITKIAMLAVTGYYDGAFDENLHGILISRCLLRVRHHIDSSNESICQSAIKCLRALLCNTQIDEVILDRIHPVMTECPTNNYWLQPNSDEFGIEMKDIDCVEKDAIRALVYRTNIIQRFTFLLNNKGGKFSVTYQECILDILIRIARHSTSICELMRKEPIMLCVIKKFIQVPALMMGRPNQIRYSTKAMKLIRILYQALIESELVLKKSSNTTLDDEIPEDLKETTKSYLTLHLLNFTETQDEYSCSWRIETLRLMKTLCQFREYIVYISDVLAISRTSLWEYFNSIKSLRATREIDSKISYDWQYAAHLIDLIGTFMANETSDSLESHMTSFWSANIRDLLYDWITSVVRSKFVPHLDVSIAINVGVRHQQESIDDTGTKSLSEIMLDEIIGDNNIKRGYECDLWKVLIRTAADRSKLLKLTSINGCLRDPKSLPSFGCLNYNSTAEYKFQLNPIFNPDSPHFLMDAYMHQLHLETSPERVKIFVNNLDLIRYIRSMSSYNECDNKFESIVQHSIMAQYEVEFLARSISLMGGFYLTYSVQVYDAPKTDENQGTTEPQDIEALKLDTYSNLCYYAISVIGLLGAKKRQRALKNGILADILLSSKLQSRVSCEAFGKSSARVRGSSESPTCPEGKLLDWLTQDSYISVLNPLYLSCEQSDRYWITQPLLNYYKSLINDPDIKTKGNKWFNESVDCKSEAASAEDKDIVRIILAFNFNMLRISPSYNRLVVSNSLDDYLSIIGSVLLDDDIFLEDGVNMALCSNLKAMLSLCSERQGKSFKVPFQDANRILRPLNLPVADFFNKLVEQFEAVSYGDVNFSNFMLLFLTPGSDKMFRRKLFQEKAETCLGQLRLGPGDVWLPGDVFFEKREDDPEVKSLIRRASRIFRPGTFLRVYSEYHSKGN